MAKHSIPSAMNALTGIIPADDIKQIMASLEACGITGAASTVLPDSIANLARPGVKPALSGIRLS